MVAGSIVVGQPPDILQILGLGSCVAVSFYYSEKQLGALAHIMLPSIAMARTPHLKGKYADTAIPLLFEIFQKKHIPKIKIDVKIIGGSHMFPKYRHETFDVGNRNIEAVKNELKKLNLKIKGVDTGGTCGRSLFFILETGKIYVLDPDRNLRVYY
ncbi:MAG: chemotaxis protein CheD [Promethearchaeota archaeon]